MSRQESEIVVARNRRARHDYRLEESGLMIVPLSLDMKDGRAMVEIALARGKKTWDKRHALAERQAALQIEQAVGQRLKRMRD